MNTRAQSTVWHNVRVLTWLRKFNHPEAITAVLLIIGFWISAALSPYFLQLNFLMNSTTLYMEVGISALAMTFVIIAGEIDLSVASTMALTGCVTAWLFQSGMSMVLAIILGLILSVCLGLFNAFFVIKMKLPSLAVTLGTLALFRGLAEIIMGEKSISHFPAWFSGIDMRYVDGTGIPWPLAIFSLIAIILGLLLHRTVLGRWIYAVGANGVAARYAGVPVSYVKAFVFCLSGLASGIGGIILISRLAVARFDLASGWELDVITAVVLGGTDIFGGRGTIIGTVMALFLVGILRVGMGVANIMAESQLTIIGGLLVLAVILSKITSRRQ